MNKKTVAIALSGGVDSAASALLLIEQGYNVFGITMKTFRNQSTEDAEHVAEVLGIKHYIVDYSDIFEAEVINKFIDIYLAGGTPNPCIICNSTIKYGLLLDECLSLGADYMAMGHYAKINYNETADTYHLCKSDVVRKDQSYFLYHLNQEKLKHLIFPLYNYKDKADVRKRVMPIIPHISQKKDSTNLCFTEALSLTQYIKNRIGSESTNGNFIDTDGSIIGVHDGIFNYTIGQKRGLNINTDKVYFVSKINAATNQIVLTENENDLFKKGIYVKNVSYINPDSYKMKSFKCTVKVCQWGYYIRCTVTNLDNNMAFVEFDKPERAPAIGQNAVFYNDDEVLGGGFIHEILD